MAAKSLTLAKAGLMITVAVFLVLLVGRPQDGKCQSPLFVGAHSNPGISSVTSMIQHLGGLPQSSMDLGSELSESVNIYPVASWEIMKLSLWDDQPLLNRINDDDPTYGIAVDIQVHFADGHVGLLRWTAWRYGLMLCPIILTYGDGPPGRIELLDLK